VRTGLVRILDIGADPADDPDLVVRKRTAVGTLLALCAAGVAYIVMGWVADRPLVLAFAVIQISAQLINLAIFSRLRRLQPFVWTVIGLGLLTTMSGVLTLGGLALSGGNVIWVLIAPVGAIMLIGGRAGLHRRQTEQAAAARQRIGVELPNLLQLGLIGIGFRQNSTEAIVGAWHRRVEQKHIHYCSIRPGLRRLEHTPSLCLRAHGGIRRCRERATQEPDDLFEIGHALGTNRIEDHPCRRRKYSRR